MMVTLLLATEIIVMTAARTSVAAIIFAKNIHRRHRKASVE
uniref:Bm10892 n=1 Tax=Brugia malayi TaxID=6279 RepID=A0A0J9Y1D9_BRUMA|nr:Bm10892 [Brugia malayi]